MQNMNLESTFTALDLGTTQPTSVPNEVVEVEISVGDVVRNYGKAFVQEAYRKAPLRAEQVKLTEEEITKYCDYLLAKRVECVRNDCPDFRKLKVLYIPSFIQYVLAQIGEVRDRDLGLTIRPVVKDGTIITFDEALMISEKIGSFINDLQIVQDAMPREITGNSDVMSTAMIAGYIRAYKKVSHVSATYITAFLSMKLKQETAFAALYRVQYDDVDYIVSALTTQKVLY